MRRFYRDGFRNVGLDQVLADVGISKTAFYKHFESKEDLMLAALEMKNRWLQDTFREAVRERGGHRRPASCGPCSTWSIRSSGRRIPGLHFCERRHGVSAAARTGPRGRGAAQASHRGDRPRARRRAGAADPRDLARELCLIMEGAYITRQVTGDPRTIDVRAAWRIWSSPLTCPGHSSAALKRHTIMSDDAAGLGNRPYSGDATCKRVSLSSNRICSARDEPGEEAPHQSLKPDRARSDGRPGSGSDHENVTPGPPPRSFPSWFVTCLKEPLSFSSVPTRGSQRNSLRDLGALSGSNALRIRLGCSPHRLPTPARAHWPKRTDDRRSRWPVEPREHPARIPLHGRADPHHVGKPSLRRSGS